MMNAITEEAAIEVARQRVAQLAAAAGDRYELLLEETKEVGWGWLFFFSSADFVRSRNSMDALVGNGPWLVRRDGQVQQLPSPIRWEEALKQI
jgi:hypothetical protein